MKFFILVVCVINVLCYKPPLHNSFYLKRSEFSNNRFPVKLSPLAEYRRAKFFETRKKLKYRQKSFTEFKKKNTTKF